MTAPIWMAMPPEVHSSLLGSGPGPGALLSAAQAWSSLAAEYSSTADELTVLLGSVHAGAWQGAAAERFESAYGPYLAWLKQESVDTKEMAARHDSTAAAYIDALAAAEHGPVGCQPRRAQGIGRNAFLRRQHDSHRAQRGRLRADVGPAAAVMTTYQTVADAALTRAPKTTPAPRIVKSDRNSRSQLESAASSAGPHPLILPSWIADPLQRLLQLLGIEWNQATLTIDGQSYMPGSTGSAVWQPLVHLLKLAGINWNPATDVVNGNPYATYTNPGQPMWWVVRSLEFAQDFETLGQDALTGHETGALQELFHIGLVAVPAHIFGQLGTYVAQQVPQLATVVGAGAGPSGSLGGFTGMTGLAALSHPVVGPGPSAVAAAPAPTPAPVAALPQAFTAPGTGASMPAPAPTSPAPPGPAPTPTSPAPAAGPGGFVPPYAVPPGIGFGSGLSSRACSSARSKAPEPDSAAAAAVASAREAARSRRRWRAKQRDHGNEFLDMDLAVEPDWDQPLDDEAIASDRSAGDLGFGGTARRESVAGATGLATLAGDEFGGGPKAPMLPGTWDRDGGGRDAGQRRDD